MALVASLGLAATLAGCNPDEGAKPTTPPPSTTPAVKSPAKASDAKGTAPAGDACTEERHREVITLRVRSRS